MLLVPFCFPKASDNVNHDLILQNLAYMEFQIWLGLDIIWVIEHRYVIYIIAYGVSHWSILGPWLLSLHVNDLGTMSKAFWPVLFADNASLFLLSRKYPEAMRDTIINDFPKLKECRYHKLSLNILRIHYMIVTTRKKVPVTLVQK